MLKNWKSCTVVVIILLCTVICLGDRSSEENDENLHPYLPPLQTKDYINLNELNSDYWISQAHEKIKEKLQQKQNNNNAKNIIMFLGDGMSVHTITATRALINDISSQVFFEKFPYFGLSKTYCVDSQVADSACSATAYLGGVKANLATIGVNAHVEHNDCKQGKNEENHVQSIAKWAQDANKATGIVTTTRITHASPAGVYAHTVNRDWECDSLIKPCSGTGNIDIAQQLVHWPVGKNLKVVFGGGRSMFLNETINDEEGVPGSRKDGKNLIKEWLDEHKNRGDASYIWNRKSLLETDIEKTDYLLGLFSPDHCPFNGDRLRKGLEKADPSLTEMTEIALKLLQKEKNGYFLFVEGGRIDHAHHYTQSRKALEDTIEFANAISMARNMTSEEDTLILITSDHAHTMSINGYPDRRSDILGLSKTKGDDNLPLTILSYANGPGHQEYIYQNQPGRRDLTHDNFKNAEYRYPATVPLIDETHGGDDVGVFASGPQAHIFGGNYEQSHIPTMIASIAQIGPFQDVTKNVLRKKFRNYVY